MNVMRNAALAAALVLAVLASGGPTVARAQTATQRIAGPRLEALAKPALARVHLGGDAELQRAFAVPDQIVPAGTLSLEVGSAIPTPAYVNVPITIDVNGRFIRQIFVGYRVQRFVRTAVAAHDLVPGSVLTASDVKMARVPWTGQRTNGTNVLVGRKILAAVRAGSPIAIEATQVNQIVKPGATVVMIVRDGGVAVVADVVARTGGGLGDNVSVYNPQTNKSLSGTVIGPDRVELNLSGDAP